MKTDEKYMRQALKEAEKALKLEEVPIGAVVVYHDEIIAGGHNLKESLQDPTAHAEMIAIREAAIKLKSWRLSQCQLYVTVEPCPMCAGAMLQARIPQLIFGAADIKAGVAGSLYNIVQDDRFNHHIEVKSGILVEESRSLLQEFFRSLREK